MKYDHRVKIDGKWFDAGVEVDVKTSAPVSSENKVDQEKPQETPVEETVQVTPQEKPSEEVETPKYTRTQIQQMNSDALKNVAAELGLEAEEKTVKELKAMIMAKLGI